jgi:Spy/CpxP family protein refolding chaperone
VTAAFCASGALLLLLAGGPAGQAPGREGPPHGDARPREEAFKIIDAYIVSNLQESLSLTDEQFVKVLPLVKRLLAERRELVEARRKALRELRQLLEAGGATEAKVADRLREIKELETDEREKGKRDLEALDAALSTLQQAKFRVMEIEIEQKIRELLNQARQRRRPGDVSPP